MSIRLKLTVMFLALALIPLMLVSALTFNNYKQSLEADHLEQLQVHASFKARQIEEYFNALKTYMVIIQKSNVINKNFPVLMQLAQTTPTPDFIAAKQALDETLQKNQLIFKLLDLMLVNTEGKVIYASGPEHSINDFSDAAPATVKNAFNQGLTKIYLSDIFSDKEQAGRPAMLITAPACDLNGHVIGVIAFEADMQPIYNLIRDITGLGHKTGEILIGKKSGNQVVFLNPLRQDSRPALNNVLLGSESALPMQEAVQGRQATGQTIDYRGKKVVAAWRYLPSLEWGLVAKIDTEDAFADIINLRNLIFIILAIVFILAGIMAVSIALSIAGPIKKVAEGAKIIGSGNLDYKVGTNLKDEIGQLARAFNKMTGDLKNLAVARDAERQRLYGVLETLPVYVLLLTEDYHVPFANRFFRERFGESNGQRCHEYLFKRNEPCENCETYKVLKTDAAHRWEWTGPDGRNYDIYDYPFRDTDGSRMILEMGIDITEQKRAQESLRSAAIYARSLIEVSLDPLVTISSEGKITDVNETSIKVTGVPREQLIGTDFSDYFTEPDKAREGYRLVFTRGFVTDYPLTIRHKNGHLTDVLYNASVYKDIHGKVIGVFAAAHDVTFQKQASQYARSLIESSPDPLVTISASGKITDVNEATIKVTGVPREQLIGTDFSDYFTEPDKAREGYRLVFTRGFVTDYPLTIRHKNGHLTDVLYNASVYKDIHGKVIGVFAAARDVTVLKQAEAELRRHRDNLNALVQARTAELEISNKELASSNENLEQFAYVASHDLQEPLRIMSNYSQLLERRYKEKLDKDADDFIGFIVDAAKRMQKLITDLLEYSRTGSKNVTRTEVDCNEVLRKVTDMMSAIIESDHAIVSHDNLPVLTAHETGLIQLFQNLIGNALKFHGKQPPIIHVSARRDKNEWLFSVRDNGIGIEPQYRERIFQIFQRLHSIGEYPGTGIGLSICKKIVEYHGGRIWVESEAGKGATFYFTIPT